MWLLIIVLIVTLMFLFDRLYEKPMKDFRNNLPGPVPLPILGNSLMALGDSTQFIRKTTELIENYGERVRAYMLSTLYILLINPKDVEAVITSNNVIGKSIAYKYLHPWLGQGLLTATGMKWRKHRKFLTPAFHFNILQNFLPIFEKNDKILTKKLRKLANGKPVNVFPLVALAALDNVSESAMGVGIEAQSDSGSEYVKAVNEISEIVFERIRHPVWRFDALFRLSPKKIKQDKYLSTLHGFTYDVIKNRRQALQQAGTTLESFNTDLGVRKKIAFLDLLLLSELDGKKLSDETIREEVDTFMFEGHDTTTSAISFTLYSISKYPHIQEKLYQEQYQIFGDDKDRSLCNSDLAAMSYLELVIKETLRLYPSVPYIARQVAEDTHIVGLDLPKGTNIVLSMFHMHRLPSVFEDPLTFKPERFLPENISKKNAYSWISFSAGPRNCIGQKFAIMEMKVALSGIIRHFKLLPAKIEPVLCADLILRSVNGVFIEFQTRP